MWKFLGSTRLAIVLIGLVTLLLIVSALVPQTGIAEAGIANLHEQFGSSYEVIERFGLDRIYFSPAFYIVLGLLGLNLAVGTFRRFRSLLKLEGTLLRLRHMGSIVFHLSLLLIICSAIANYLYKFDGVMALTEGQRGHDSAAGYFRMFKGPLYHLGDERFSLQFYQITANREAGGKESAIANVILSPMDGSPTITQEIATNKPLQYEPVEVHFGLVNGYSPEFVVIDNQGDRLFASFVRLSVQTTDGQLRHFDFVQLPQLGLEATIRVEPADTGTAAPQFLLTVTGRDSATAEIPMAASDTLSAFGCKFLVPRWRRWCYLNVVENPYLLFVFAGFWSALAGLSLGLAGRMAWRRREAR